MGVLSLAVLIILSFYYDFKYRTIPNFLTISGIIVGWTLAMLSGVHVFYSSILATSVGLSLLLIPYLLGGVGGGDIKLLAAIGSLTNVSFVLHTTVFGLILAGIGSLYIVVKRKGLKNVSQFLKESLRWSNHQSIGSNLYIPLGCHLSTVAFILLLMEWWL